MIGLPWIQIGVVAGGVILGSAAVKLLTCEEAKKCYTKATAAALRAKDAVKDTVTSVCEGCSNILADAKELNAERAAANEDAIVEDAWEEDAERDIPEDETELDAPEEMVSEDAADTEPAEEAMEE